MQCDWLNKGMPLTKRDCCRLQDVSGTVGGSRLRSFACLFLHAKLFSTLFSLCFGDSHFQMNTDSDRNCDVHLHYEVLIDENGTHFKCSICLCTLSRMQRIESHLRSVHGIGEKLQLFSFVSICDVQTGNDVKNVLSFLGCFKRKYKRYVDDPSVPIPKSTKFDRIKRLKMSLHSISSPPDSDNGLDNEGQSMPESTAEEFPEPLIEEIESPFGDDLDLSGQSITESAGEEYTEQSMAEIESTLSEYTERLIGDSDSVGSSAGHETDEEATDDNSDSLISEFSSESEDFDSDDQGQEALDSDDETQNDASSEKMFQSKKLPVWLYCP